MARTEIAGFRPQSYGILQAMARKTARFQNEINNMGKAYPVDAGVATSCGALPLGGDAGLSLLGHVSERMQAGGRRSAIFGSWDQAR
jgi:hypothetical protein